MKSIRTIIVQAGGLGSRLETLTKNKPKALVPVKNRPILFHLFDHFPDAHYKIIVDYKGDVLEKYLKTFSGVSFETVAAKGKGTSSGINAAIQDLADGEPFMLIWCDLLLPKDFCLPNPTQNYIGISKSFQCRWSFVDADILEMPSSQDGIAGLFIFKDKSQLSGVPSSGELVRWLSSQPMEFERLDLSGGTEVGTMLAYQETRDKQPRCRPFNAMTFEADRVVKKPITPQGEELSVKEKEWYKFVTGKKYPHIPEIYSYAPLTIERIHGKNIFEYALLNHDQKQTVLAKIIDYIRELHSVAETRPASADDCIETYYTKTFARMGKVQGLIPFAKDEYIRINGHFYKNPFFMKDEISKAIDGVLPDAFYVVHGDTTFSNIMLKQNDIDPVLIDPRGCFGSSDIYGDRDYDFAKLYYSIVGNYDQFNMKQFSLDILDRSVLIDIASNGWEDLEDFFFASIPAQKGKIKLLHALIWLSLTTYAWEDYDSICAAFYKGVLELDKALFS